MIEGIVITVVGTVLAAVVIGAWKLRSEFRRWFQHQVAAADRSEHEEAIDRLSVLREQVLEVAGERGIVLPASATSRNPTVVTFSDGTTSYFFADLAAYQRDMNGRRVPPTRTFPKEPPLPVSRWDQVRLEQWLAQHAD